MKKIIILISLTLLLTGCNKLNINNNITSMTYDNHKIDESDYGNILDYLNAITFHCGNTQNHIDHTLVINTNKEIFNFHLSNNYYMEYQKDNKYCYTKNKEVVKNVITTLDSLINKYKNIDIYNIKYVENYEEDGNEFNIKLDKSDFYIFLENTKGITNFKINEIEYTNDNYEEIDLIYSKNLIDKNKVIIRKDLISDSNIKISFINNYGYSVNIIPTLNKNNITFKFESH